MEKDGEEIMDAKHEGALHWMLVVLLVQDICWQG